MFKKTKRLTSLIMALLMVITMIPFSSDNAYALTIPSPMAGGYTTPSISGEDRVEVGKTIELKANYFQNYSGKQWTSSDTSVATVNNNGKVTGKAAGTVTIKYSNYYQSAQKTITVYQPHLTGETTVNKGATITLTPTDFDSSDDAKWESSKNDVATVDKDGVVTGKKAGTTTITYSAGKGPQKRTATLDVTVTEKGGIIFEYVTESNDNTNAKNDNGIKFMVDLVDKNNKAIVDKTKIASILSKATGLQTISIEQNEVAINASTFASISIPGFTFSSAYAYFYWSGDYSGEIVPVATFKNYGRKVSTSNTSNFIEWKANKSGYGGDSTGDTGYYYYQKNGTLHVVFYEVTDQNNYKTIYHVDQGVELVENDTLEWKKNKWVNYAYDKTSVYTKAYMEANYGNKGARTFEGWYTNSACTEAIPSDFFTKERTSDVTLYAKWSVSKASYTINYVLYGSRNASSPYTVKTAYTSALLNAGTKVTVAGLSNDLKNVTGYTFAGASAEEITIGSSANVLTLYYYKNVSATAAQVTATYDGTAKTASGLKEVTGTITGYDADFSNFTTSVTKTEVGEYELSKKALENLVDLNGYYKVTSATAGYLKINAANTLNLTLTGGNYVYDKTAKTPSAVAKIGDTNTSATIEYKYSSDNVNWTSYSTTVPSFTNAGTYYVQAKASKANYENTAETSCTITIAKRPVTITVDKASKTFGESDSVLNPTITVETFNATTNRGLVTSDSASFNAQKSIENHSENVGTYTVLSASYNDLNNYVVEVRKGILTINPKAIAENDVSTPADGVYNGSAQTPAISVTVGGTTLTKDTDYTVSYSNNINAGTASVIVTGKGNYGGTVNKTFIIKKRPVNYTVNNYTKKYGESDPATTSLTGSASVIDGNSNSGLVGSDTLGTVTYVIDTHSEDVNTTGYQVLGVAKVGDAYQITNSNYYIANVKKGKLIINRATDNSLTLTAKPLTYNGSAQDLVTASAVKTGSTIYYKVATYAADGTLGAYSADWTTTLPQMTAAGKYCVKAYASNSNYDDTAVQTVDVTIAKRNVTITATAASKTYGQADPTFTGSVESATVTDGVLSASGLVGGDSLGTVTYSRTNATVNAAGTYENVITANCAGNANYNVIIIPATFTISKKSLADVTVSTPDDVVYNGDTQEQPITVTDGSTTLGESDITVSYSSSDTSDTAHKNVAKITVTISATESGNYTGSVTRTYDITQRPVTITVSDRSRAYGALDTSISLGGTVSAYDAENNTGLVNGDDLNITYTIAEHSDNVGTYTGVLGASYSNSNYDVTVVPGNLTITPIGGNAVNLTGYSRIYDGGAHGLNAASATQDGSTLYYSYSENGGAWSTPTANDVRTYTNAGTYKVKVYATNPNYNRTAVTEDSIVITKRPVTITATSVTTVYGDAIPTFEAEITSEIKDVNGDLGTLSASRESTSANADNYTLVPAYSNSANATVLNNYDVTLVNGTFTILKQSILSGDTAEDQTTVIYRGVTVDNIANVTYNGTSQKQPVVIKDAKGNSLAATDYTVSYISSVKDSTITDAGRITVTIKGQGNYTGTVTKEYSILPREVYVEAASAEKEYDGKTLTADSWTVRAADATTGLLGTDAITSVTVTGSQLYAGSSYNVPTAAAFAEGVNRSNYHVNYENGTLTVKDRTTKYSIVITPNSGNSKYDGSYKNISGIASVTTKDENLSFFAQVLSYFGLDNEPEIELISQMDDLIVVSIDDVEFTITGVHAVSPANAKDAGSYDVTLAGQPQVWDEDGKDVTNQFDIDMTGTGTLTINPRQVTLTSDSSTMTYNGSTLAANNVTVGGDGFADGEGADYEFLSTQTAVGTTKNEFTYTLHQNTLAKNYSITTVFGWLTVAAAQGGGSTIVVNTHTLTIHYVDEAGNAVANDYVGRFNTGAAYLVASPAVTGYTPNFSSVSSPEGGMPDADVEVTVVYTANGQELIIPVTIVNPEAPETVEEEATPAAGELITDEDGNTSIVAIEDENTAADEGIEDTSSWALLNLIAAILTAFIAIVLTYFAFKKKEEDAKNAEEQEKVQRGRKIKLLSIIPAVAAIIAFVVTEDVTTQMTFVDKWTILMVVLLAVNAIIAFVTREKAEEDDVQEVKSM